MITSSAALRREASWTAQGRRLSRDEGRAESENHRFKKKKKKRHHPGNAAIRAAASN